MTSVNNLCHPRPCTDSPFPRTISGVGRVVPFRRFEHIMDTIVTHWHHHLRAGLSEFELEFVNIVVLEYILSWNYRSLFQDPDLIVPSKIPQS